MVNRLYRLLPLLALLLPLHLQAQTSPPNPVPGWSFSTAGGFSNVSNAPTNNGFVNVTELRLSEYYAVRGDVFLMTNPQVIGSYISAQGIIPASKIFKNTKDQFAVNSKNVDFFINAGLGDIRSTDPNSKDTKAKFSWRIGAGFNVKMTDHTFLRPLDISYLRGGVFQGGGAVVGNHLQVSALLGIRF